MFAPGTFWEKNVYFVYQFCKMLILVPCRTEDCLQCVCALKQRFCSRENDASVVAARLHHGPVSACAEILRCRMLLSMPVVIVLKVFIITEGIQCDPKLCKMSIVHRISIDETISNIFGECHVAYAALITHVRYSSAPAKKMHTQHVRKTCIGLPPPNNCSAAKVTTGTLTNFEQAVIFVCLSIIDVEICGSSL